LAKRIRGEDSDEDVDAFLKGSRDSLHGKYWGPDSLVPVRLVDMRDEPPPAPVRKRPRVRRLDVVVGVVGLVAGVMIFLSLQDKKPEARADTAPPAHARPTTRSIAPARLAVARNAPSLAGSPVASMEASEPASSVAAAPAPAEPASSVAAAPAPAEPASSVAAAPSAEPKKRRPKPAASHAPPTASFPD
jgi:hypothetical protein